MRTSTLSCFFFLFCSCCFFLAATNVSAAEISYTQHCGTVVAESRPTVRVPTRYSPLFDLTTNYYFWGGGNIFGEIKKSSDPRFNVSSAPSLSFRTTRVFETITTGIYRVEAYLMFRVRGVFQNYTPGYGYNDLSGFTSRRRRPVSFNFRLNGFWSEDSRKLCMVGVGSWQSNEGNMSLKFASVFEMSYAKKNATLFTSLAKGKLKSSSNYFEAIQIVSFPTLNDYNYTLSSRGSGGGCSEEGSDVPQKHFLDLKPNTICSAFQWRPYDFDLEYTSSSDCKSSQDCSPFVKDPAFLSLSAYQCSESEGKLRYMLSFRGWGSWGRQSGFDPNTTLIGEGSWDSKRNQLCIVACRVLNPFNSLEDVSVGDCSIRLNLRFPQVWSLKNTDSIVGVVWTNKTVTDHGYFKSFRLSSTNSMVENGMEFPGLKYEYTETKKVRELCPWSQVVTKTGDRYPGANSYDLRFQFHMSDGHSKVRIAWGDAIPIAVGNELYSPGSMDVSVGEEEESTSYNSQHMNVSYKLTLSAFQVQNQFFSINSSLDYRMEVSAEGLYDPETGNLCMIGCREIHVQNRSKKSLDCEILMKFQFPALDSKVGSSIQGYIQSMRAKNDSLYFKPLNISAYSYYTAHVRQTIWRMDLEIVLVLISNTLLCIFVAAQMFYVKKNPGVLPFISVVMLCILTLGTMIPLVLNLEALLQKHNQEQVVLKEGESLEWNEVSVRMVSLVAFLLLLRLLQMAWTARKENGDEKRFWDGEKKTAFVTLLLYTVGGVITLLVEWMKKGSWNGNGSEVFDPHQGSTLTYLRSYAGLVLDGFLLPQILINLFQNSADKTLSCFFYIGTTLVRLLPHAYDLYRAHSYRRQDFSGAYIYANPSADFYSIAWDVIIPCGCVLFAVIVWLQQRFGGRCVLPRKFREFGLYEKVPAVSSGA